MEMVLKEFRKGKVDEGVFFNVYPWLLNGRKRLSLVSLIFWSHKNWRILWCLRQLDLNSSQDYALSFAVNLSSADTWLLCLTHILNSTKMCYYHKLLFYFPHWFIISPVLSNCWGWNWWKWVCEPSWPCLDCDESGQDVKDYSVISEIVYQFSLYSKIRIFSQVQIIFANNCCLIN